MGFSFILSLFILWPRGPVQVFWSLVHLSLPWLRCIVPFLVFLLLVNRTHSHPNPSSICVRRTVIVESWRHTFFLVYKANPCRSPWMPLLLKVEWIPSWKVFDVVDFYPTWRKVLPTLPGTSRPSTLRPTRRQVWQPFSIVHSRLWHR